MIDSLMKPYINEKIEEFNEQNEPRLESGYEKFKATLTKADISEELKIEMEHLFNSQVNEAIRISYMQALKSGFLIGAKLMDEIRSEL